MENVSPPLSEDPIEVTTAYLKHRGVKGTIIFAMLTGSQAYNLAHQNSDKDYLGTTLSTGALQD